MPMTFGRKLGGVWGLVLGLMIVSAAWGSSAYLQTSDWQYKELDALAQQGLLVGHPAAPISTWSDRLSRYEAAALTLRAVEGIGRIYQEQGTKLRELAQVNETGEAAPAAAPQEVAQAPDTTEVTPASPTVRTEDLVRVGKLVEEFRTELVAMGEKVDELGTSIKLVLGMVEDLQKQVDSVAGDQKRHKLDGYIQYRAQPRRRQLGSPELLHEGRARQRARPAGTEHGLSRRDAVRRQGRQLRRSRQQGASCAPRRWTTSSTTSP